MAELLCVHHAQIGIPPGAEAEARAFYSGVLGLEEIYKPEALRARGGFWLGLGEFQVHFSIEPGVDRWATKAHLAYQVTDLEGWRARLREIGVEAKEGTAIPGYRRFEFRDPFGNRVEFMEQA